MYIKIQQKYYIKNTKPRIKDTAPQSKMHTFIFSHHLHIHINDPSLQIFRSLSSSVHAIHVVHNKLVVTLFCLQFRLIIISQLPYLRSTCKHTWSVEVLS